MLPVGAAWGQQKVAAARLPSLQVPALLHGCRGRRARPTCARLLALQVPALPQTLVRQPQTPPVPEGARATGLGMEEAVGPEWEHALSRGPIGDP